MNWAMLLLDSSKVVAREVLNFRFRVDETLNISDAIRATIYDAGAFDFIVSGKTFVQIVNIASGETRTYRVNKADEVQTETSYEVRLEGARIWKDMAKEIYRITMPDGSYNGYLPNRQVPVSTIMTSVMASSAFQLLSGGSAESNSTLVNDLDFSYANVLQCVQDIAEQSGTEIFIDESTAPASIDLRTRGNVNGAYLEYAHNLPGITRTTDSDDVVNRIFPVGGGVPPATCEGALFQVFGAPAGSVLTIAGEKIIPSTNTFTGGYKIEMVTGVAAGNKFTISATTRGTTPNTDTLTTSSTPTDVADGDFFKIIDSADADIDYLFNAASVAEFGTLSGTVLDAQFEDIRTLITPGYMDGTYTANLQNGWTKTGAPTLSKELDPEFIQHGSASQKVDAADGESISYDIALTGADYYSTAINVFVTSGSVLAILTTPAAQGALLKKNGTGTTGTGWFKIELTGIPIDGSDATLTLESVGASVFYVDAAGFTPTQQNREFVRENSARELWRMAFDELDANATAQISYALPDVINYTALDPDKYQFDAIAIGDTVTVRNLEFGIDSAVRVLTHSFSESIGTIGIKLATHTDMRAAFNAVVPGSGQALDAITAQEALESGRRGNQAVGRKSVLDAFDMVPAPARASRFTGSFVANTQTTFEVGSGILYVGDSVQYTINTHTPAGMSGADATYHIYFDPNASTTGFQVSDDPAVAFANHDNIQIGIAVTGNATRKNVRIFETVGANTRAELHAAGFESYDRNDVKRVDIGELEDLSGSILLPNDGQGIQLDDGVLWQSNDGVGEYTGASPGYHRVLIADHGAGATTGVLNMSFIFGYAVSSNSMFGHFVNLWNDGDGESVAYRAQSLTTGIGDATAFQVATSVANGDGDAYGFKVNLWVRAATGDAYGIHIGAGTVINNSSGDAYGILVGRPTVSTGDAYDTSFNGIGYRWPSVGPTVNEVMKFNAMGDLEWVSVASIAGVRLNDLLSPINDTTFAMTTNTVAWNFTNPSGGMIWNFTGAAGGHSLEILQSVGNPGADMHLLHIEAADADPLTLHLVPGSATSRALKVNPAGENLGPGRFIIDASGAMTWGDGTAAIDTTLQRAGAAVLSLTGSLIPSADSTYNSASAAARWATVFADNVGDTGQTMTVTGSVNFDGGTLFVDHSNGRVGIGTVAPDNNLHVMASDASATSGANTVLTLERNDHAYIQILTPATKIGAIQFGDPPDDNVGFIRYDHNTDNMYFAVNASEAMRLDSSQNVSIPNGTLTVAENLTVTTGGITVTGNSTIAGTLTGLTGITSSGAAAFATVTTSGTLGVGTAAPSLECEIKGTDLLLSLNDGSATGNPGLDFRQNDAQKGFIQYIDSGDTLHFSALAFDFDFFGGSAGVVAISSTGNFTVDTDTLYVDAANDRVGVNVTPAYALHVVNSNTTASVFAVSTHTAADAKVFEASYTSASANDAFGFYAVVSNGGAGEAYSFYGAAGKFLNVGDSQITGAFTVTSATTLQATLEVAGILTVDTDTLYVDVINDRAGVNRIPTAYAFEVGGDGFFATSGDTQVWLSSGTNGEAAIKLSNDVKQWDLRVSAIDQFSIFDAVSAAERLIIDVNGDTRIYKECRVSDGVWVEGTVTDTGLTAGVYVAHTGTFGAIVAWENYSTTTYDELVLGGSSITLASGGTARWDVDSSGHFVPGVTDAYNFGSTTSRVNGLYLGDLGEIIWHDGTDELASILWNGANEFKIETTGEFDLVLGSNSTDVVYINGTGATGQAQQVGIGRTPSNTLDVQSQDNNTHVIAFRVASGALGGGFFDDAGNGSLTLEAVAGTAIQWGLRASGDSFFLADNGGFVVGKSSTSYDFEVSTATSGLYITSLEHTHASAPFGLRIDYSAASPDGAVNQFIYCEDSTELKFQVASDGDVTNRNNSYGGISDERLKGGIENARYYTDDFMKLKYKTFFFEKDLLQRKRFGLIAQDVQEVFPSCTFLGVEGYLGIKSSIIYSIQGKVLQETIAAVSDTHEMIQNQDVRFFNSLGRVVEAAEALETHVNKNTTDIDDLRNRVDILTTENEAMARRLDELEAA